MHKKAVEYFKNPPEIELKNFGKLTDYLLSFFWSTLISLISIFSVKIQFRGIGGKETIANFLEVYVLAMD